MKSVKEVAIIAGISVRTLHYYDEINLLNPSQITSAGYRRYSPADIMKLQKILLLKEVGFQLTDINKIMKNKDPTIEKFLFDKQKKLMILKKKRLENLIEMVDSFLGGEQLMFLEKFDTKEIDNAFISMMERLKDEEEKEYIKKNGGNLDVAKKNFEDSFSAYEGDLKHYLGDKDMSTVIKEAPNANELEKRREKITLLYQELGKKVDKPINNYVLSIIKQIHDETVSLFPIEKKEELFRDMAELYVNNVAAAKQFDKLYGEGSAEYYYKCVKKFYNS